MATKTDDSGFADLLARTRRGDGDAAAELFAHYEPYIRRVIRQRMTSVELRRQMDSMDLCQSVMGDFFVRAALGDFELRSPDDLIKLLATMARNRVSNCVRNQHAIKRDVGRMERADIGEYSIVGDFTTPSIAFSNRELLDRVRALLTEDERHLAEQRAAGKSWAELAAELHEPADALRMRHKRAIDRVSQVLGLESS